MKVRTLLMAMVAFGAAGCNVRDDAEANATSGEAALEANANDMTPEQAGIFDNLLGGGEPMKLAIQQLHPNGGVLNLNSIQVKPTETVLNVTYVNGHTNDVPLDWSTKKTYLFVGGRKFFLVPPVGDDQVQVRSGATMTGDLVFMGAVPQAEGLQLIVNDGMSRDGEYSSIPGFLVDIPVTQAAYADDGSKKTESG